MLRRVALACVALGLLVRPASASSHPFAPWPDFDSLAVRYPGAPAVCLLDEEVADLQYLGGDDFGKRGTHTLSVAILDPAKAGAWLEQTIPNSDWHHLTHLEARTWTGPATSVEVKNSDIFDIASFPDFVLFSDVRGKRFAFPAAAPRTVVELRYEFTSRSDYTLAHTFADVIPVLRSRAVLGVPEQWIADGFNEVVRAHGMKSQPAREQSPTADGNLVHYVWELNGLPALPREPRMPPLTEVAPRIIVLPLPLDHSHWDWPRLGRIYWDDLFAPRMGADPAVVALAETIAAQSADPLDRLARAARFVAHDIRYVAIELGVGGYEPHRAGDVLRNRYGDCKDKVCLLLALLKQLGIEAQPALVRTAEQGVVDTSLVDLAQFDHMIARVRLGDRIAWVDPTAAACPTGELPWGDQSTFVLLVGQEGGSLAVTPTSAADDNEWITHLDGTLTAGGDLAGWLRFTGYGAAGAAHRAAFRVRDAAEERRLAAALLDDRLPGARLLDFAHNDPDSVEVPFELRVRFERPGAALVVDRSLVLLPVILGGEHMGQGFEDSSRVFPVELDYLRRYRDGVSLALPAGYTVAGPLPAASVAGDFFTFDLSADARPGRFDLETTVANRALTVWPDQYVGARDEMARTQAAWRGLRVRFRPGPETGATQ